MIIRFSKRLSAKIKEPDLPVIPPADNPFLDWHAHLFMHSRAQYIMVSNSKSLFSIFMHGAGITDFNRFYESMNSTLRDVLHDLGADLIYQRIIVPNTGSIRLAKAQDKRIIGSMNEHIFLAKAILDEEDISPYNLSFRVNENILTILKYAKPKEEFLRMGAEGVQAISGQSETPKILENKTVIDHASAQEKPTDSGPHLRLWKPEESKTGRNDPCPCGSGKKYKKCCGKEEISITERIAERGNRDIKTVIRSLNAELSGKNEEKRCFICGKSKKLIKTPCCDKWICDDEDQYVMFSYAQNSCFRNHWRYTLCGSHFSAGHEGDWKTCKVCREEMSHELEMYVWYGTNEYNHEKLPNPPAFKPTFCAKCRKRIVLPEGGYTIKGGKYYCERCVPLGA